MKPEIIDYILEYFSSFMNEKEATAWRHYSFECKLGNSDNPTSIETRRRIFLEKGWLT